MEKQIMSRALNEHAEAYRRKHPTTADMDISIFQAYCKGKSAVQISMDVPCSESTVYRAVRRVESFLEQQNTRAFANALRKHLSQVDFSAGNCDVNSILELLYCAYKEACCIESNQTDGHFETLCKYLSNLSIQEIDPLIEEVCSLCRSHEETGFVEGIKVGIRMIDELNR